jgi:hypothetical protein
MLAFQLPQSSNANVVHLSKESLEHDCKVEQVSGEACEVKFGQGPKVEVGTCDVG